MIDQKTVNKIMDTARIEEVVGDFVSLRKSGANYMGLCPFHDEKTPSFSVSPAKGIFKCFSCGKGGNVVHFVKEHEQISYSEALKWLAKRYHIEVVEKELSEEEIQRNNDLAIILLKICTIASKVKASDYNISKDNDICAKTSSESFNSVIAASSAMHSP